MSKWKTTRGESYVAIPCAYASSVSIGIGGVFYELLHIEPFDLHSVLKKHKNRELLGAPIYFCPMLLYGVTVWPTPDKEYDVVCEEQEKCMSNEDNRSAEALKRLDAGEFDERQFAWPLGEPKPIDPAFPYANAVTDPGHQHLLLDGSPIGVNTLNPTYWQDWFAEQKRQHVAALSIQNVQNVQFQAYENQESIKPNGPPIYAEQNGTNTSPAFDNSMEEPQSYEKQRLLRTMLDAGVFSSYPLGTVTPPPVSIYSRLKTAEALADFRALVIEELKAEIAKTAKPDESSSSRNSEAMARALSRINLPDAYGK